MSVQEELPLQHTPQLTGWLRGTPAVEGWYNTRRLGQTDDAPRLRRYWTGSCWSRPVTIGEGNELAAKRARMGASVFGVGEIEYQGLTEPHPDWSAGHDTANSDVTATVRRRYLVGEA